MNEGKGLGLLYLLDARMTADENPDLRDQASRLWSIAYELWSDRLVQVFGDGGGHPLVFSPDGKLLATATRTRAQFWDTVTGQPHGPALQFERTIDMIAFSPDGRLLATGARDRTTRLWDVGSRRPYGPLLWHSNGLDSVVFSPDGQYLASRPWFGMTRLWRTFQPLRIEVVQRRVANDIGTVSAVSLGKRRNQEGQITPTEWKEWHELRGELARTIPAREPQLSDAADSRGSSNITLLWTPGSDASAHNVYFGTNPDQLKLLGKVEGARYENLPPLDRDTTYWWRVDTLKSDGSVIKGDLWTFRPGKIAGWWKLDGDVTDSAGSGYDGEIINGGQWVDGRIGGALQFDGEDDFVSLPNRYAAFHAEQSDNYALGQLLQ